MSSGGRYSLSVKSGHWLNILLRSLKYLRNVSVLLLWWITRSLAVSKLSAMNWSILFWFVPQSNIKFTMSCAMFCVSMSVLWQMLIHEWIVIVIISKEFMFMHVYSYFILQLHTYGASCVGHSKQSFILFIVQRHFINHAIIGIVKSKPLPNKWSACFL